jgi:valine--pyruvate aminotransferase
MNCSIHSSRYGQAIAAMAIESGEMAKLADQVIRPFYKNKFEIFHDALDRFMPKDLPWYVHEGEGSIFGWIWLKDLPITDWELYQILKKEKVLVVPGKDFFPGLTSDWKHKNECIRISLTASKEEIENGIRILARIVQNLYSQP